jgi:Flp pilus assembly protein TadG
MRTTKRRRRHAQRGTQILEFAIVLPILMFFAIAVSEGASFIHAHEVLNNAANDAARIASLAENADGWNPGPENSFAVQAACDYLRANSGAFVNWNAAKDTTCGNPAFTIQVTRVTLADAPIVNGVAMSSSQAVVVYRYPLQMFPALSWVGLPNPLPLRGTAQFRNFY